jgi:2-polyprenyl-6-methoxyphenol hydroxylase-like FAD-dependent oxidoreductase
MSHSPERDAGRHAIVIGGGIAGLAATRVLTEHFERVTLVERDCFSSDEAARRGAPQRRHAHVLLASGHRAMARLFPGVDDEMEAAGAPAFDVGADCISVYPRGRLPRRAVGIELRLTSREFRENLMRRRLAEDPRVSMRDGVTVQGLAAEGRAVGGVRLRLAGGGEEVLRTDLVVAACGREAPVVDWLSALGYPAPREVVVDAGLSYSSRWYRLPRQARDWRAATELPGAPDRPRGGVVFSVERDTWVVTLMGTSKSRTPTDEEEFKAWANSLQTPYIHDLIKEAEPISPIYGFARTANRWRHFESMSRFPERFVVLGDAAAAFNPVYGQGMTIGMLGALELGACLEEQRERVGGSSLTGLSKRFQRRLARVLYMPWEIATGEDFRWPGTTGERPGSVHKVVQSYFDVVLQLATEDPEVHAAMLRATHLLDSPTALFRPAIASRVLGHAARPVLASAREVAGALARFAL